MDEKAFQILILEDSVYDLELIVEQLTKAGYNLSVTHVLGETDFRSAIEKSCFDIILSDFNLPGFDAFGALEISQEFCPDVPFICISGGIGEETAVELLKKGAVDYVMKDKPGRLPFTIQRALDEANEKRSLLLAEENLKLLSRAVEASSMSVVITDVEGTIRYVNPYFLKNTGYSYEEVVGSNPRVLKSGKQSKAFYEELWQTIKSGNDWVGEFENVKKNGEAYWEKARISPILKASNGEITHFVAIKEDITDKKNILEHLVSTLQDKEHLVQELSHRSYNNMQVMLAYIEYRLLVHPELTLEQFVSDIDGQIQSMVLAHRQLNKGDHLSKIDLDEYIQALALSIVNRLNKKINIKLNLNLDSTKVLLDSAVPLGTVVNELISNAVKYAYPTTTYGEIAPEMVVSSSISETDVIEISIHDNGINWATSDEKNTFLEGRNDLAISIVKEQLGGTISIDRNIGTTIRITFKDNRYSERV